MKGTRAGVTGGGGELKEAKELKGEEKELKEEEKEMKEERWRGSQEFATN